MLLVGVCVWVCVHACTQAHHHFIWMFYVCFLARLSRRLKGSYCDHSRSVCCCHCLSVLRSTVSLKYISSLTTELIFNQISHEWSLAGTDRKLFKDFESTQDSGFHSSWEKNLLVRNHWTDFSIIWQKCSFGDPLSILFKPSWFVKKHGCQAWLIFPIYLNRKL